MRNTNILKYTSLQQEIFRALCKTTGAKVNQRAIAKRLQVTPAAVSRALPALQKDHLIFIHDHGEMNLKEIELHRENHKVIQLKRVENLRALYVSELVDDLSETYAGCTIIVFGSYARGEDTITSDIDIIVIGAKEKTASLEKYEKLLERPVRIMYVDSISALSKEFRENVFNGIVLTGGITL